MSLIMLMKMPHGQNTLGIHNAKRSGNHTCRWKMLSCEVLNPDTLELIDEAVL